MTARMIGPAIGSPSMTSACAPRSRSAVARTSAGTSCPAPIEAEKMETVGGHGWGYLRSVRVLRPTS